MSDTKNKKVKAQTKTQPQHQSQAQMTKRVKLDTPSQSSSKKTTTSTSTTTSQTQKQTQKQTQTTQKQTPTQTTQTENDDTNNVDMNDIIEVQLGIEETEKKMAKEMMKLDTETFKLMTPHFKKRDLLTDKIPSFWITVFNNHPVLSSLFTGRDSQLIAHMTSFKVETTEIPCLSVRFVFNFSTNSLIKNKSIWKEYRIGDDGEVLANSCKLQYKNGSDITRRNNPDDEPSFFSWFDSEETEMEIYKIFKDDIWLNPLDYHGIGNGNGTEQTNEE
ncbi:hypothetical protein SAMD00019534_110550 [Acytostelium subglobosum LB1]|uniref:hypothetical protein n=1 Tax=Acytostelium subglobosum LB1 TaxID=1410327 RepID=UPI000644CC31|nr:hypothetical protein SAMD00019534_110550 [Acytostelium subglobosum LB1]GAM27879.1 hypothetical protein SAMD00019534_110550 [Acytostelium subglobosum LB1]|eukprot:XP_012749162.1 hypothetical protein SAMD00019534_110550 [Acytostelium subglobosum LB1]